MASVVDRQSTIARAKAACKRAAEAVLGSRAAVVAIVDDEEMTRLHRQFLGKDGPTDVLSFPSGEIVVSADTAAREARARGIPPLSELILYVVHGALHLDGHDDNKPKARARMRTAERRVLRELGLGDVFGTSGAPKRPKRKKRPRNR